MKRSLPFLMICLLTSGLFAQTTLSIPATKDATIYESISGDLCNGSGNSLYIGSSEGFNPQARRALLQFDLSQLPDNVTITEAALELQLVEANANNMLIYLHRLNSDWGEGNSDPGVDGSNGTNPTVNDASWLHRFFPVSQWNTAGGDFESTASAVSYFEGGNHFSWGSQGMISDVQSWINDRTSNFGWILIGNEQTTNTYNVFHSKESDLGVFRPQLIVKYITSSGIDKVFGLDDFSIHPIPAADVLTVRLQQHDVRKEAEIIDITGRKLASIRLSNASETQVDVSKLTKGIYFLNITSKEGKLFSKKFVKE